jgi:hypothetical protein
MPSTDGGVEDPGVDGDKEREFDRQREQFHRELMRKSMRIAELELMLGQTQALYESSISWRVTRPIRAIRRLLRRGR